MRKTAWLILTATALASVPARAQTYDPHYPVCIQVAQFGAGLRIDCSFTSIAQCRVTASGRAGTCFINPYFANVNEEPRRYLYRRHRRVH